jgi:hypothetical protein
MTKYLTEETHKEYKKLKRQKKDYMSLLESFSEYLKTKYPEDNKDYLELANKLSFYM